MMMLFPCFQTKSLAILHKFPQLHPESSALNIELPIVTRKRVNGTLQVQWHCLVNLWQFINCIVRTKTQSGTRIFWF